jgi:hypothetical protein
MRLFNLKPNTCIRIPNQFETAKTQTIWNTWRGAEMFSQK